MNDEGLVIECEGKLRTLAVDTVVICAGQESYKPLLGPLLQSAAERPLFVIGGALEAGELDAKRAIDQGTRLAAVIETAKTGQVFDAPVETVAKVMQAVQKFLQAK